MEAMRIAGPTTGDAFGLHLADSIRLHRPMVASIECSDGRLTLTSSAQWMGDEATWPAAVRTHLAGAKGRVLDVGGGSGRHASFLAGRSLHVTVLDTSPLALEICRQRGVPEQVLGDVKDVRLLLRDSPPFETVLLLGNNVGLLESTRHGRDILRQLHEITLESATLIAEGRRPGRTPDDLDYSERNRALGRMPGEYVIRVRYRTLTTPWFRYLFCEPSELAAIAEPAGWKVSTVEDFRYPGDDPGGSPMSYVAVLRKTSTFLRMVSVSA